MVRAEIDLKTPEEIFSAKQHVFSFVMVWSSEGQGKKIQVNVISQVAVIFCCIEGSKMLSTQALDLNLQKVSIRKHFCQCLEKRGLSGHEF